MRPSWRVVALLVVGGVAVLALAVGAGVHFWPPGPRPEARLPPDGDTPPAPRPHKLHLALRWIDESAYLVRLGDAPLATPPAKFWAGLFEDLARDPATAALLRRLFGGLRVQIVVLEAMPGKDDPVWEKRPDPGFDVVVRVCNGGPHVVRTAQGNTKAGGPVPVEYLVGTMSLGLVIDADPPADLPRSDSALLPPDSHDALKLAVEDHLLRQEAAWRGVHFGSVGEHAEFGRVAEGARKTPAERRKDLDARIEEFAGRYRGYLAGKR